MATATTLTSHPAAPPAKVVIERRVHPGSETAFKHWAERFVADARRYPSHEGASVLAVGNGLHVILLRFATIADLDRWRASAEHADLMREANELSASAEASQVRSGFETWFTLPDMAAPSAPPPAWKMAVLTWVCLLPMVVGLGYLFAPFRLPFLVEAALSTAIPVSILTWVVMPRLTRMLYTWLYEHEPRPINGSSGPPDIVMPR